MYSDRETKLATGPLRCAAVDIDVTMAHPPDIAYKQCEYYAPRKWGVEACI